jgi:spoIIIJ-associated protein
MLEQKKLEKIKKTSEEFFKKMCFEVEIEIKKPQDLSIPIYVKTEEPKMLIGEKGQTLIDIQRILKAILKKSVPNEEQFYIDLDINNYKEKKITYLKEMSRLVADEVALSKKEKILAPMPAYERRIIHLEISGREDIASESVGQEPERSVIIRPYP